MVMTHTQARSDKLAEQEAKEAGEGRKRGRGRPLGSKTKPKPEDCLGPSSTPLESAKNLLAAKKMSGKINFDRLDDLFEDDEPERWDQQPHDTFLAFRTRIGHA